MDDGLRNEMNSMFDTNKQIGKKKKKKRIENLRFTIVIRPRFELSGGDVP